MRITVFVFLTLFLISFNLVLAGHFRGGVLSWKLSSINSNGKMVVKVTYTLLMTRIYTGNNPYFCNQTTIDQNIPVFTDGKYVASQYNPPSISYSIDYGSIGSTCLQYSESGVWSLLTVTLTAAYTYQTSTIYPAYINGGWLQQSVVNGNTLLVLNNNGTQKITLISQLNFRNNSKTKTYNRSPIASLPLDVFILVNTSTVLEIPVSDPDGDNVKCRWATGGECPSSCYVPSNIILDSSNCKITFSYPADLGIYILRLQIEDFLDETSPVYYSSLPVSLLLKFS
jgi:hypothetical protein